MMNGRKVFRWTLSLCLAAVLTAAGVGLYQLNTKEEVQEQFTQIEWTEDVNTESVEGTKVVEEIQEDTQADTGEAAQAEETASAETETEVTESAAPVTESAAPVEPAIDFTEESLMEWPVNGNIVLDYSMDQTIYYQTLDLYRYSPAIAVSAEVNTPVLAAANGRVLSIASNEETGVTVTMDMGNGYEALYGQLKEVSLAEGDTVESGTIIGYISEPTKYYCKEGANLYFAMRKDGAAVDPLMYLP